MRAGAAVAYPRLVHLRHGQKPVGATGHSTTLELITMTFALRASSNERGDRSARSRRACHPPAGPPGAPTAPARSPHQRRPAGPAAGAHPPAAPGPGGNAAPPAGPATPPPASPHRHRTTTNTVTSQPASTPAPPTPAASSRAVTGSSATGPCTSSTSPDGPAASAHPPAASPNTDGSDNPRPTRSRGLHHTHGSSCVTDPAWVILRRGSTPVPSRWPSTA
jgi:hypothetical protein